MSKEFLQDDFSRDIKKYSVVRSIEELDYWPIFTICNPGARSDRSKRMNIGSGRN